MRTLPSVSLRLLLIALLGVGIATTAASQLPAQSTAKPKTDITQPPQRDRIASRFRFVPTVRKDAAPRPPLEQSENQTSANTSPVAQKNRFATPGQPSKIVQRVGFSTTTPNQTPPTVLQSPIAPGHLLAPDHSTVGSGTVFLPEPVTFYPRSNFFGISEDEICDEWDGFCGCGGLKSYRGHFGIPSLLGFGNCETCSAPRRQRAGFKWGSKLGCDSCGKK